MAPMLSRRQALSALAGTSLLPGQTRPPNLLFILADDLGWSDVSFNGRREWSTPNLDRLAREGTVFDRWYTAVPLCAPSRACLLTGKYTIHNTVRTNTTDIPASETTIAEMLKPAGYATALIGKWHKGRLPDGGFTHPLNQGFDSTFGYLDARHAWEHFPKTLWRGRREEPVTGYSSDILADESIRFFQQNRQRPFYLHLAFIEPHFLIEAPEENVRKFAGKFKEKDPANPFNARYAAMLERFDQSVGRVLDALEAQGLRENTLVVFTSDNGATFESGNQGASWFHDSNRPHRGQKRSLEEGGIRLPGIVRWPGRVPAGKRTSEIVHNIDVLPTFAAAAGVRVDPGWGVDGVNQLPVWTGRESAPDRTLFWEFNTENVEMYAALRGDYKLLRIGKNDFLYNVRDDPQERRTLAGEMPQMLDQFRKELAAWLATERRPG
jgi:arylsulfatase A-like enzyme